MPTIAQMATQLGLKPHIPAQLEPTETALQVTLPAGYREFCTRYGAQRPHLTLRFPLPTGSPWGGQGTLEAIFGITDDPTLSLTAVSTLTYAGRIPDQTIPIAADPGDNLVLIGVEGLVRNQVFFWDHEHRELEQNVAAMAEDLEAAGDDLRHADAAAVISRWKRRFQSALDDYDNVYRIADTFEEFLGRLRPSREAP
jgi:hypothetical protein